MRPEDIKVGARVRLDEPGHEFHNKRGTISSGNGDCYFEISWDDGSGNYGSQRPYRWTLISLEEDIEYQDQQRRLEHAMKYL